MASPKAPVKELETCPHCGKRMQRVPIAYGYPSGEMGDAAGRGEIVLGGCVISGDDPQWACPKCREALDAPVIRREPVDGWLQ